MADSLHYYTSSYTWDTGLLISRSYELWKQFGSIYSGLL